MQVDSGADMNITDEKTFEVLKKTVTLSRTSKTLFLYKSTTPSSIMGKFPAVAESANKIS